MQSTVQSVLKELRSTHSEDLAVTAEMPTT